MRKKTRRPIGQGSQVAAALSALFVTLLLAQTANAQKPADLRPQGYVNDFAGVVNPETQQELNVICAEVDQKAQAQIAVVAVKSLEGEPIDDFSIDLATRWGIGPKQKDRGVMILLAPNEHQYRFEVGYGLEPILPDGLVGDFGREAKPLLRAGNYSGALLLMTTRVAQVIAKNRGVTLNSLTNQPQSPSGNETEASPGAGQNLLWLLFLLFFLAIGLLARIFGGRGRNGRGHNVRWGSGPWFMGGMGGGSWGGGGFGGGSFGGGGASGSW